MAQRQISAAWRQLEEGLTSLRALPEPHYVVFVADLDPETGAAWCPDVRRCLPIIERIMAEKGASLLEVLVGAKPEWKDPAHPLRHHPQLQLKGVPTLVCWGTDGPTSALGRELEDAATPAEVEDLVTTFVKATS